MRLILFMLFLAAVSTASSMDYEDRVHDLTTMAPTEGWLEHV